MAVISLCLQKGAIYFTCHSRVDSSVAQQHTVSEDWGGWKHRGGISVVVAVIVVRSGGVMEIREGTW